MKTAFLVILMAAMLVVTLLVVRDLTSRGNGGQKANITVIDRAQRVRDKAEQAGRDLEKKLDQKLDE